MSSSHEVTRLLHEWARGDETALAALTPLVYLELRRLAESYLRREGPGHTLQPTALVHEAYLRFFVLSSRLPSELGEPVALLGGSSVLPASRHLIRRGLTLTRCRLIVSNDHR